MLCCTKSELELQRRFEDAYARSRQPVMQEIERAVCGCDYGGNSWTTKEQADELIGILKLHAKCDLIDLGAGTGWPGLYLAKKSKCRLTLVDLPEIGLQLARRRAVEDGLSNRVSIDIGDAANLAYPAASFDAISHSDLLCCLVQKRAVLRQCRRIIRSDGRMAFTVISIVSGLSEQEKKRALANAPDFVECESGYRTLLHETGWQLDDVSDLTDDYAQSCSRQIEADVRLQKDLAHLLGPREAKERLSSWRSKLSAIQDGLFLRELFLCRPGPSDLE